MQSNSKGQSAKKKSASVSQKKKKVKGSTKEIQIKKPAIYSTNTLAARVYLQNGRVVIPNFKDYKEQKEPVGEPKSRKNSKSSKISRYVYNMKLMNKVNQ